MYWKEAIGVMFVAHAVRVCLAPVVLVAGLLWSSGAPAFDGDSKTKSPTVAEAQGQNTPTDPTGTLPSDRSAYRTAGSQANSGTSTPAGKPLIKPDKETTYILKPLRDDGFPDYFAALNEHCRGALQADNNVAVSLLQAFGPSAIPAEVQDEYFNLLGNKFQRPVGAYFVQMNEMVQRWMKGSFERGKDADLEATFQSNFALATQQPWSAAELPMVAEWLAINEIPLKRIADASQRARFYEPIVSANRRVPALWAVSLPMEHFITEITTALEARAMFRAQRNDFTSAIDDLLICHRLLRKLATYPIGQYAVESRTAEIGLCQTELKLLHFCRPTQQEIESLQKHWNELPPMPSIVDRVDVGDRFRFLDAICLLNRQGPAAVQQLFGDFATSTDESALQKAVADALFDWNEPLRMGNQWFDTQAAICRLTDRNAREQALQKSRLDLQTMLSNANSPSMFALNWFTKKSAKAAFGRMVGASLLQLFDIDLPGTLETCDQHALHLAFTQTGMALAAYRADHDQYPKRLEELAPKYLVKVPRDLYSDHDALRYHRETSGYTLYSVGRNGLDEQGAETERNPNSDDIAITITDSAPIVTPRQ
jgi:hypothetical protein